MDAVFEIGAPTPFRGSAEFLMCRCHCPANRTEASLPFPDVVEESRSNQVRAVGSHVRNVSGSLEAVALVKGGLGEEKSTLYRRSPGFHLTDLDLVERTRADNR